MTRYHKIGGMFILGDEKKISHDFPAHGTPTRALSHHQSHYAPKSWREEEEKSSISHPLEFPPLLPPS